jgi:hypothetical protein
VDGTGIREKEMMKLSDAIEKGWQYVPKIEDEYQRWDYEEHKITGACAIGAACYAARPGEATTCDIEAYRIFATWLKSKRRARPFSKVI